MKVRRGVLYQQVIVSGLATSMSSQSNAQAPRETWHKVTEIGTIRRARASKSWISRRCCWNRA